MRKDTRHERQQTFGRLVALIEELRPFLDTGGRACCQLPHPDQSCRTVLPLTSPRIESWLIFKYREAHCDIPRYVKYAMSWVEGKLLASRRGPFLDPADPTLRCFLHMAFEEIFGAASASEILDNLRIRGRRLLRRSEKLPASSIAMGRWLSDNQEALRSWRIDLQKNRSASKRLWIWQTIVEAGDTNVQNMSQDTSLLISRGDQDFPPAMTDDELRHFFPKETFQ